MFVLTKKTLDQIKESKRTRLRLAFEFNKVDKTIYEWIANSSPMLTTPTALQIIREELNIPETEEILEQQ